MCVFCLHLAYALQIKLGKGYETVMLEGGPEDGAMVIMVPPDDLPQQVRPRAGDVVANYKRTSRRSANGLPVFVYAGKREAPDAS